MKRGLSQGKSMMLIFKQEITERAMNGELDFSESLKARVALLKGVPADVFEKLKSVLTISPGARELCNALKTLGFKLAVLSGGFQPLADWLAGQLGLDYAFANHVSTTSAVPRHLSLPRGVCKLDDKPGGTNLFSCSK